MAKEILIRPEQPGDEPQIRTIHQRAFPSDAESRLVDNLRTANRLPLSLLAACGDSMLGHIALSPVTLHDREIGWGLAPVAVLPEFQRQGIAHRLIEEGLRVARKSSIPLVVVLGSPAYYSRFGFQPAARWQLSDEYAGREAFQALELTANSIPASGGLIKYAPEFSIFC